MDLIEYSQSGDGYAAWQQQRLQATKQISQKLGLPLGHEVELRLLDGVILRGRLRLREELLFPEMQDLGNVELAIGRATFKHSENRILYPALTYASSEINAKTQRRGDARAGISVN